MSTRSICEGMIVAMEYAPNSKNVAEILCTSITSSIKFHLPESNFDLKALYAKLYLISDILFNTSNPSLPLAWSYRKDFDFLLPQVFDALHSLSASTAVRSR